MDDEALVLLPGWGVNSSVFESLQELLEPGRSLSSPGLPGYCGSPWQGVSPFELQLEQMPGETQARALSRKLWQQIVVAGKPDIEVLRYGLELLESQDSRSTLASLKQSVKLVLGECYRPGPIALLQQISDVAPLIQVESVAGAAHAPFLSYAAEVASLL